MKWLEEIRDKVARVSKWSDFYGNILVVREETAFKDGFNVATKAISEKLQEIDINEGHSSVCHALYNTNDMPSNMNCDCWKYELKKLGLVK